MDLEGKVIDSMTDDSLKDLYEIARASALGLDERVDEVIKMFRDQ